MELSRGYLFIRVELNVLLLVQFLSMELSLPTCVQHALTDVDSATLLDIRLAHLVMPTRILPNTTNNWARISVFKIVKLDPSKFHSILLVVPAINRVLPA